MPAECSYGNKSGNKFSINALDANLPSYEISDDKLICYCGSPQAQIIFSEIVPSRILSLEVDPPVIFNQHNTSTELRKWRNAGKTSLPVSFEYTTEKRKTESLDISTEIGLSIRSKVSGGYGGIQAEVEAQLQAKLGITSKTEKELKETQKQTLNLEVPRWTETSLMQTQSVSDVKQMVRTKCLLDAKVTFNSDDDWAKSFDSLHELILYIRGGGGGQNNSAQLLDEHMATRAFQDFDINMEPLQLTLENERVYRDTKTGEASRVDTNIKHGRKRKGN